MKGVMLQLPDEIHAEIKSTKGSDSMTTWIIRAIEIRLEQERS